jgi:hypothetical protein
MRRVQKAAKRTIKMLLIVAILKWKISVLLKPVSTVRGIIAADKMSKLESIKMRQIYVRRRKIKEGVDDAWETTKEVAG